MASSLDKITTLPPWQLGIAFLVGSGLLGAGWHVVYYSEAVMEREAAERGLEKQKTELKRVEERQLNFDRDMAQAAKDEKELEVLKSVLPSTPDTVDHLMRKFQQQGRLVGLSFQRWTPVGEKKFDFYAKLPINIEARGTWHQVGEFFRRVSEMTQIVNIEEFKLKATKGGDDAHPMLDVGFTAFTFRELQGNERGVSEPGKKGRKGK